MQLLGKSRASDSIAQRCCVCRLASARVYESVGLGCIERQHSYLLCARIKIGDSVRHSAIAQGAKASGEGQSDVKNVFSRCAWRCCAGPCATGVAC